MKLLITGPRGFIASHLIHRLESQPQIQVVLLDRSTRVLPSLFAEHGFDSVVHLATQFLKTHDPSQIPALIESNLTLTTQLLDCAQKSGVKRFITFGTYYEFPVPASLYAATKAAIHPIVEYYLKAGLPVTELALYDTYGPGDTRAKILNALIDASHNGSTLPLSPGHQKMKLLHVDDITQAILDTLQHPTPLVGRFALEPLETMSLREIALRVEKAVGKPLLAQWGAREYTAGVAMEPSLPYPPLPGWKAQISLDQGLIAMVKKPKADAK